MLLYYIRCKNDTLGVQIVGIGCTNRNYLYFLPHRGTAPCDSGNENKSRFILHFARLFVSLSPESKHVRIMTAIHRTQIIADGHCSVSHDRKSRLRDSELDAQPQYHPFLGLWERLHNVAFNYLEFEAIESQSGLNNFALTPKTWIERTGAMGMQSKQGRYAATFAHQDIAFEFASWISPEFKLYIVEDYLRLKTDENRCVRWRPTMIFGCWSNYTFK